MLQSMVKLQTRSPAKDGSKLTERNNMQEIPKIAKK